MKYPVGKISEKTDIFFFYIKKDVIIYDKVIYVKESIDFIKNYVTENDYVVCATSGGVDSMTLLYLLTIIRKSININIKIKDNFLPFIFSIFITYSQIIITLNFNIIKNFL